MVDTSVTMITDSDWKSWRVYVLKELERLSCNLETLEKEHRELKTRVDYLDWRSGAIGAASGIIVTVALTLFVHYH